MRFFTEDLPNGRKSQDQRERSKTKVMRYGFSHSSVAVLQALVILALDSVGSENGPETWHIVAVMTRLVTELELATETTRLPSLDEIHKSIHTVRSVILPKPGSWIERECRRRLFWMVYLLDTYTTIVTAFDFNFDEAEIGRRLPCDDVYFQDGEFDMTAIRVERWFDIWPSDGPFFYEHKYVGAFSFYVDAVHMLSMVHKFLRRPIETATSSGVEEWRSEYRKMEDHLGNWLRAVPIEYGLASGITPVTSQMVKTAMSDAYGRVMLHATYHT